MTALLPFSLIVATLIALVLLIMGLVWRARLSRRVVRAWDTVPRDDTTGLLLGRVCAQRLAAELKRAQRSDSHVWVGIITVIDGDADRFGRLLVDGLRVPEIAFRLAERVVCVVRPDLDEAQHLELVGRIRAAGPRERLAIGETRWFSPADGDARDVLHRATTSMEELAAP